MGDAEEGGGAKKRLVPPKGCEFLKDGGGETLSVLDWPKHRPHHNTEVRTGQWLDTVRFAAACCAGLPGVGETIGGDGVILVQRDDALEVPTPRPFRLPPPLRPAAGFSPAPAA